MDHGTLRINSSFFILGFILYLFPPTVWIDGEKHKAKWGDWSTSVPAGSHEVKIVSNYLWFLPYGPATTQVTIDPGQTTTLTYRSFVWFPWIAGKLTQGAPA